MAFVILTSGQSNFARQPSFTWGPNTNATIWNNAIGVDGSVGTAFVAIPSATVSLPNSLASAIARETGQSVYLVNISIAGLSISHWLPGTSSPDMYSNITNNVPAALSAIGAAQIDLFAWWQGEGDTAPINANYLADFEAVITRLKGNAWFPGDTPILIHGMAATSIAGNPEGDHMNALLVGAVNLDPSNRLFVYTSALPTSAYWDATNPGHMTALGYQRAGEMAASMFLNGPNGTPAIPPGTWISYSPVITAQGGSIGALGAVTGRYQQSGKTVRCVVSAAIVSKGTAIFSVVASLPVPAAPYLHVGTAYDSGLTAKSGGAIILPYDATHVYGRDASGATFFADGAVVTMGITYEAA